MARRRKLGAEVRRDAAGEGEKSTGSCVARQARCEPRAQPSVEQLETRIRVRALALDVAPARPSPSAAARKRRIVLDRRRAHAVRGRRNLHARIENARRGRTRLSPPRNARARRRARRAPSSGVRSRPSPCSPVSVPPSAAVSATTVVQNRVDARRASRGCPTSTSGFTWTCASPRARRSRRASRSRRESRERRGRTPGDCAGGTAPSSMNCIDRRFGSSRARIGLAACRSSHSSVSVGRSSATRTVVAPASRKICLDRAGAAAAARVRRPLLDLGEQRRLGLGRHRTRRAARRARRREMCDRAVRRRPRQPRAPATAAATAASIDRERAEHAARRTRRRREVELESRRRTRASLRCRRAGRRARAI